MSRDLHIMTGLGGMQAIEQALRKELDGQNAIMLEAIYPTELKLLKVMLQEKIISSNEHDSLKNLLFSSDTESSNMANKMIMMKAKQIPMDKLPVAKESPEQILPELGSGIWQQMSKVPSIKYDNKFDMTSLHEAARYMMSKDELDKADELRKNKRITSDECEKLKAMILSPDDEVSAMAKQMLDGHVGIFVRGLRKKV